MGAGVSINPSNAAVSWSGEFTVVRQRKVGALHTSSLNSSLYLYEAVWFSLLPLRGKKTETQGGWHCFVDICWLNLTWPGFEAGELFVF